MDLLLNIVMTVVDVGVLEYFRRQPGRRRWFRSMLIWASLAFWIVLIAAWAATGFGARPGFDFLAFRFASFVLFLHVPLTLLAAGLIAICRRGERHWRLAIVSWVGAFLTAAIGFNAFLIEPTSLAVTEYRIVDSRIDRPVRVVLLADLQTDLVPNRPGEASGAYQRHVFETLAELKPDVVLLGGDYIHTSGDWNERLDIRARLRTIIAKSGFPGDAAVYGVQGNIDPPSWPTIFESSIEAAGTPSMLTNATKTVRLPGFDLTLLDMRMSRYGSPLVGRPDEDRFHIVLGHAPDYSLAQIDADLLLSGHTHGGQVRLPIVGALRTHSRIPSSWAAGLTELPPLKGKESARRRLIVSRGIGMECVVAPRLRFLCRPELVVIDLLPANN